MLVSSTPELSACSDSAIDQKCHLLGEPRTAGVGWWSQCEWYWHRVKTPAIWGSPTRWPLWFMALLECADDPGEDYCNKQKKTSSMGFHSHRNRYYKAKSLFVTIQQHHRPQRSPVGGALYYWTSPRGRAAVWDPSGRQKNCHTMEQCHHPSQYEIKLKAYMQQKSNLLPFT